MLQVGNVKITHICFHDGGGIQVDGSVLGYPFGTSADRAFFGLPDPSEEIPDISIMKLVRHTLRQWASKPDHQHADEFMRALRILDGSVT